MRLKQLIVSLVPSKLLRMRDRARQRRALAALPRAACDVTQLRAAGSVPLETLFDATVCAPGWDAARNVLGTLDLPEMTGGVNRGDQRAIFRLIEWARPTEVLEVGTHIGASTIHIAAALRASGVEGARLTTVDIAPVNDEQARPWLRYGSAQSPLARLQEHDLADRVEFRTSRSLDYMRECGKRFDLIFLDGDHSASAVYQEIPAALALLKPNGIILLHDYFPGERPLWNNGYAIPGPVLGVQRLLDEGAPFEVLPLGTLPWETKLGSRTTSLALLLRRG